MGAQLHSDKALVENFAGLFLDLDGVCYLGQSAAPHAPAGLQAAKELGIAQVFITNNSGRTPQAVAAHLQQLGIAADAKSVVTSAMASADQLQQFFPHETPILCIGGAGLQTALANTGFQVVFSAAENPRAVVQGLSPEVSWRELSEACLAIKAGAQYFATNIDATLPQERGEMIGNGSLVAAVTNATGVTPITAGKPDKYIYEFAARYTGVTRALAVGDRLNTDIAGAVNSDIPALHVLTGVNQARDVVLAPKAERPTYLGIDLLDLTFPYPKVAVTPAGIATVLGEKAWVQDQQVLLNGTPVGQEVSLAQYRAIAAAVWHFCDHHAHQAGLTTAAVGAIVQIPDFAVVRA